MNTFTPLTPHPAALQEGSRIYRGRTVDELIPRIVAELGEDALVVRHHRGLTGGFAGFFQRPFVEIEARRGGGGQLLDRYDEDGAPALPGELELEDAAAALPGELEDAATPLPGELEDDPAPVEVAAEMGAWATNPFAAALAEAEAAVRAAEPAVPPDLDLALAAALADAEAEAEAEAGAEAESEAAALPAEPAVPPEEDPALAHTESFLPVEPVDSPSPAAAPVLYGHPEDAVRGRAGDSVSRGRAEDAFERAPLERALLEVGFDEWFVDEAIEAAAAHLLPLLATGTLAERGMLAEQGMRAEGECLPASVEGECLAASVEDECLPASADPSSPSALAHAVRRALRQRIPVCPPLPPGPATIAFVGPGGSGKSACCATLLDAYHRHSTLPAACVALVAGGIGGPPAQLEVVLSPHSPTPVRLDDPDAAAALRDAREAGLLLLDTPPLSPADPASIGALAAALERLAPDRVVLALPATLGAKPAVRLLEAYRPLGTSALAFTHTDETDQLGVVVQVACALGAPPAYLLEGDGSGRRLTSIDPGDLVDRLLPER